MKIYIYIFLVLLLTHILLLLLSNFRASDFDHCFWYLTVQLFVYAISCEILSHSSSGYSSVTFFLILIVNYIEYENLIFCPSVLYYCCLALLFHCPWHNWTPDDPGECKCLWILLKCLHLTNVNFVPTVSLQRN